MSAARPSARQTVDLPQAAVAVGRRFSIVWVAPLIAAIVVAWLAYQAWFSSGPRITIRFEDGTGLAAGQTPVHYHGIECGVVDTVALSKNLSHVVVRVSLKKEATALAREGAKFWIVRPQVSLLGVRGLDTLVSGPYIQALPGTGAAASDFTGLADPPPPETLEPGLDVVLESDRRGALRVGSPVYYRGVEVGKVKSYRLSKNSESVQTTVYVDAAHAGLVRTTSQFWNVSGLQMNVGVSGANLDLESIESLLTGGVSFDTPVGTGAAVKNGTVFRLQDRPPEEITARRRAGLRIALIAKRLGGIGVGAPVAYRQVKVGEVEKVGLAPDPRWVHIEARIDDPYRRLVRSTSKFWNASGMSADIGLTGAKVSIESLQSAINGGIQFATPDDDAAPVNNGATFNLYEKAEASWTEWAPTIAIPDTAVDEDGAANTARAHRQSSKAPSPGSTK